MSRPPGVELSSVIKRGNLQVCILSFSKPGGARGSKLNDRCNISTFHPHLDLHYVF